MPDQGADLSGSPLPPARPSAADLAAPALAPRIPSFGSLARPTAQPAQADMPAPSAVSIAGQAPQAAPTSPGVPPTASPASPAVPGGATPAVQESSFFDKVGDGLRRFGEAGGGDLLSSIGIGLMRTPGFGQGLAVGLKNYQGVSERREAQNLVKQEFGLRLQKAAQEATGLKGNQAFIKSAFPHLTAEQVAAGASNSALVSAAIAKMQNPNAGREMRADASGVNRWVDTGEPVFKDDKAKGYEQYVDAQGNRWNRDLRTGQETIALQAKDEGFTLGKGQRRYDGAGKLVAEAPGEESDGFTRETKLRTEFGKGLGTFQDVHDGYGRVIAATRQREANPNGKSPASDISLIFGYMKMLDPGSVVREGEYATAGNAGGLDDRLRNTYNRILNGESLTPAQRQDFIGQAGELYGTARRNAEAVAGRYRNLAGQYGVDPERTIFLPDAPKAPTVGPNRMQPGKGSGEGIPGIPTRTDLEAEARRRGLVK